MRTKSAQLCGYNQLTDYVNNKKMLQYGAEMERKMETTKKIRTARVEAEEANKIEHESGVARVPLILKSGTTTAKSTPTTLTPVPRESEAKAQIKFRFNTKARGNLEYVVVRNMSIKNDYETRNHQQGQKQQQQQQLYHPQQNENPFNFSPAAKIAIPSSMTLATDLNFNFKSVAFQQRLHNFINSIIFLLRKQHLPQKRWQSMQHFKLLFALFSLLLVCQLPASSEAFCRAKESRACETICQYVDDATYYNNNNNNYYSSQDNNDTSTFPLTFPHLSNCTIRALVLLPDDNYYMASLQRVLPLLQVAEEKIHEMQLIPEQVKFEWMPHDDRCDAAYATIEAMDGVMKKCAHVIFGPVCDYPLAAVSRITKYFNSQGTPLISVGGSTSDFEKKKTSCSDEFYMLLRTGMLSFETISEMTIAVMKRNKWSHSVFFYERDGQKNVAGLHTCFLMLTSLGKQMRKENMTFNQYQLNMKMKNRTEEMKREIGTKNSRILHIRWKSTSLMRNGNFPDKYLYCSAPNSNNASKNNKRKIN